MYLAGQCYNLTRAHHFEPQTHFALALLVSAESREHNTNMASDKYIGDELERYKQLRVNMCSDLRDNYD